MQMPRNRFSSLDLRRNKNLSHASIDRSSCVCRSHHVRVCVTHRFHNRHLHIFIAKRKWKADNRRQQSNYFRVVLFSSQVCWRVYRFVSFHPKKRVVVGLGRGIDLAAHPAARAPSCLVKIRQTHMVEREHHTPAQIAPSPAKVPDGHLSGAIE